MIPYKIVKKLRLLRYLLAGVAFAAILIYALFPNSHIISIPGSFFVSLQIFPSILRLGALFSLATLFMLALHILLTIFIGRIYCSTICPLGIFQDIISGLIYPLNKLKHSFSPNRKHLHYGILIATLVLFMAGSSILINIFEPYGFFARIVKDLLLPLTSFISIGVAGLMKNAGVYTVVLEHPIYLVSVISSVLPLSLIIIAVTTRGRFFCNYLCPTGAILRFIASYSVINIEIEERNCDACGHCEEVCNASCISTQNKSIDDERCVRCFNCLTLCKSEAISLKKKNRMGKDNKDTVSPSSRRAFLKGFAIAPVLPFFKRRGIAPDNTEQIPATPPGSENIIRFSRYCIACHICVSVCPTKVLTPSLFEYGPRGAFQPVMDFQKGYCEYECTRCLSVCPTKAIKPLKAKKLISIGESKFIKEECIVEKQNTACGACAEVCPTGAVEMIPYKGNLTIPELYPTFCTGCGACEFACPTDPKSIYVKGKKVHTTAKRPEPAKQDDKDETLEEFPF